MANALEVSALNRIKLHLLGELSPLTQFQEPNTTSLCSQSSTSDSFTTVDQIFSEFLDFPTTTTSSTEQNQFSAFEFEPKPEIIEPQLEFSFPTTRCKSSRRPSLQISLPKKTEWIQFGEPEVTETVSQSNPNAEEKKHYRGVRQRPWGKSEPRLGFAAPKPSSTSPSKPAPMTANAKGKRRWSRCLKSSREKR
ncbi:Ethylene-responsive transcription factor 6 [Glycine soja]|nr:Ethylene-responsive transcription factor 6 [Glycine soja]